MSGLSRTAYFGTVGAPSGSGLEFRNRTSRAVAIQPPQWITQPNL